MHTEKVKICLRLEVKFHTNIQINVIQIIRVVIP